MDYTPNIWTWFKTHTSFTDEAIAGIMGNLQCESNCEPCRRQSDFSADRSISKQYAADVDSGAKSAHTFAHDSFGWGLAQWTYFSRKDELLKYAQSKGASIANLTVQLEFIVKELQRDFNAIYQLCTTSHSIEDISNKFCAQFENPYIKNYVPRLNQAKGFFAQFAGKEVKVEPEPVESDPDEWIRDEIAFLVEEKNRLLERIAFYESRLMK